MHDPEKKLHNIHHSCVQKESLVKSQLYNNNVRKRFLFIILLFAGLCGTLMLMRKATLLRIDEITKGYIHLDYRELTNLTDRFLPTIYAITPTYSRLEQKAMLTHLSHTLMLVKNIHWVVIEDSENKTDMVTRLLNNTGLRYTHLNRETPKLPGGEKQKHCKGAKQRNEGLSWIRHNTSPKEWPGVIYFADDGNTYSLQLFEEMRFTKKVSVWPVAFVANGLYEKPIVRQGKVVSWFSMWKSQREFETDMAGFAINLKLLFDHPEAEFATNKPNIMENDFLKQLNVSLNDLEPRAEMCTKILVWHTKTQSPQVHVSKSNTADGFQRDPQLEV